MKKIRAVISVLFALLVVPFVIVLMYLFPSSHRTFRRACGRVFLWVSGVKVKLHGELSTEARIIMLNHESFLDVIFLEAVHPSDLCWVAKKELGELFLYGHSLKAPRMILIDREDKKGLISLLKEAKERLDFGRVIAIFPEGTRSRGDGRFLPFKNGAKLLAEKFELPVQPIVIIGTRSIFDLAKMSVGGGEAHFVALNVRNPSDIIENPDATESEGMPKQKSWYEEMKTEMERCHAEYLNGTKR
ncbi:MAG: lysophospholipid acyltransferase family protein [Wolinella sp.]